MFKCHVCGSKDTREEFTSEIFNINGQFYLVENIPATVCKRCGEEMFSRETTEMVRKMLHQDNQPTRSISLKVFSYGETG